MEYYFDTDDKLNRRKYAEFLKSMLENCDKYRREDSDGAYVIAIDSPWGTGKTRFAKMLRNFLEGREPQVVEGKADKTIIPEPQEDRKFNVIYYNSWDTDYWGDALEPLIHNVLNSELFELIRADKDCDEVTTKLWRATKGVLKAVGLGFARNIIGDAAAEVIKGTIDELNTNDPDPLAAYSESIRMYNQFKEALTQTIEQTGRKMVIIVDELDRCRPTFAIQTLELAKHLFSVDGLIFIFSLDIKQLSCSIKTVYGQEMDASGYLCRFFDYIGRIPSSSNVSYSTMKFKSTKICTACDAGGVERIIEFFITLISIFKLSLRDIDTILSVFSVMDKTFLGMYKNYQAYKVYLLLLTIKYKDNEVYNNVLRITSPNQRDISRTIEIYQLNGFSDCKAIIDVVNIETVIKDCAYKLFNDAGGVMLKNASIIGVTLSSSNYQSPAIISFLDKNSKENYQWYDGADSRFRWGDAFFVEDIKKWDTIKNLTAAEYFFSQLEMFNFALPADEPATET